MIRDGSLHPYSVAPRAHPLNNGKFALVIGLSDIQRCNTQRLVEFVDRELATPTRAIRLVGKCMLMVDGYNNDTRDLSQIPEVRAYFLKFAAQRQLLPFLLDPVKEEVNLYLTLVADGRRIPGATPRSSDPTLTSAPSVFTKKEQLVDACMGYLYALSEWLQVHEISNDPAHPLYKAHERSMSAWMAFIESSTDNVSAVPDSPTDR